MASMQTRRPAAFRLDDDSLVFPETSEDDAFLLEEIDTVGNLPVVSTPVKPRRSPLKVLFWASLGSLVSLGIGLAIANLIEDLFARYAWLGWVGAALAAVFVLTCAVLLAREALALRRLAKIDELRAQADAVLVSDSRTDGLRVVDDLLSFYASRPATARGRAALDRERREIIDGADLVRLAERELMPLLDAEAQRTVAAAAKRVSLVTAVAPRAILDVAVVAAVAVRLIRQIASVYGGRPGTFGFLRLLRHVLTHLALTGGMAAGEGMLDQLVGHGIAAKVSARLGEGVINGVLTARIGLAAIAVCRPLPFAAQRQPTLRDVAGGLFERKAAKE